MNNNLNDLEINKNKIPENLYKETLQLARLSLNLKKLIFKFISLNFLGAIITLLICPQYGLGPFISGLPISRFIMSYDPIICGILCASIFFIGGHILSFIFLNSIERKWIMKKGYFIMISYISFTFMLGMGVKSISIGHIHHDVFSYYASWLLTGMLTSILYLKMMTELKIGS